MFPAAFSSQNFQGSLCSKSKLICVLNNASNGMHHASFRFFIGKMKSNDVESMKYFGEPGEQEIKQVMEAMVPGASSGGITKDALKIVMTKAGFNVSDEELDFMISTADMNGDGKVYAEEFKRVLSNGTCKWPMVE